MLAAQIHVRKVIHSRILYNNDVYKLNSHVYCCLLGVSTPEERPLQAPRNDRSAGQKVVGRW